MSKSKFIISDLHLGATDNLRCKHEPENFSLGQQFGRFLQQLRDESEQDKREIELIINGDFMDFLQVPAVDYYAATDPYLTHAYLDSSQDACVKCLNLIVNRHQELFELLPYARIDYDDHDRPVAQLLDFADAETASAQTLTRPTGLFAKLFNHFMAGS